MNAAARALNESLVIATHPVHVRRIMLSKQMLLLLFLIFSLLISALSIITISDKNRIEMGTLSTLEQNHNNLTTHYNQLLLEENTWASPARVEAIAQNAEGMILPDPKQVILVQTSLPLNVN